MDRGTVGAGQDPVLFGLHLQLIFMCQVVPLFICPGTPFF